MTALEDGETLCVHRIDFDELRARHSSVDRVLVTLLARQLQRMNELLSEAFYENARRRVLRRLLELGSVDRGSGKEEIRITQEQLGALAGASRATVASVLAAERAHGTIEVRRGVTDTPRPDRLTSTGRPAGHTQLRLEEASRQRAFPYRASCGR